MPENAKPGNLFERLKGSCRSEWDAYCNHVFVNQIGDGTLDLESFQYYLMQDYQFLIHFSRAWALAVYKSDQLSEMLWASEILHSTLKTEMSLHVEFSARYGVDQAALESTTEAISNLAYTRYVIDKGMSGDLLELQVALSPCVVGYAEIGARLAGSYQSNLAENRYREWIEMYASDEYQELASQSILQLDDLFRKRGNEERFKSLSETFRQSTLLETDFWSMCHKG